MQHVRGAGAGQHRRNPAFRFARVLEQLYAAMKGATAAQPRVTALADDARRPHAGQIGWNLMLGFLETVLV